MRGERRWRLKRRAARMCVSEPSTADMRRTRSTTLTSSSGCSVRSGWSCCFPVAAESREWRVAERDLGIRPHLKASAGRCAEASRKNALVGALDTALVRGRSAQRVEGEFKVRSGGHRPDSKSERVSRSASRQHSAAQIELSERSASQSRFRTVAQSTRQ